MKILIFFLLLLPNLCLGQHIFFLDGELLTATHAQHTHKFLFSYKQTAHKPIEIDKLTWRDVRLLIMGSDTMYSSSDSSKSLLYVHHKEMYPEDSFDRVIFITRDKTKNKEKRVFYDKDSLQNIRKLQYDNNGNIIYQYDLSADGKRFSKHQYFFNDKGLDTLSIFTVNDSVVINRKKYYDSGDYASIISAITYPSHRKETYYIVNRIDECSDTIYIDKPLIINNVQEDIQKELFKRRYDVLDPQTRCSHHVHYFIYKNNIIGKCYRDRRLSYHIFHFDLIVNSIIEEN